MSTPTTIQLYCDFVNALIAPEKIKAKEKDQNYTNNVIGAIANPTNYMDFKEAFRKRVTELYAEFRKDPDNLKSFIEVLENIATHNWAGAYSELTAYYVFLQSGLFPIKLDQTLHVADSYAGEVGGKATNEDIYCVDYHFYADVKRFTDVSNDVLHAIIRESEDYAKTKYGVDCNILTECPIDIPDEEFGPKRKALKEELIGFIDMMKANKINKRSFASQVVNGLRYNIHSGGGVNSAERWYDPFQRAENLKDMVLQRYTKKIMKHKPFFLVLVNFPWDNPTDTNAFGCNFHLYRSLARRTFMQYRYSSTAASSVIPKYTGTDTLHEITTHLSGLIFIDDHAIKNKDYSTYVFLNPNARNLPMTLRHPIPELLTGLPADNDSYFDDFEHDNY